MVELTTSIYLFVWFYSIWVMVVSPALKKKDESQSKTKQNGTKNDCVNEVASAPTNVEKVVDVFTTCVRRNRRRYSCENEIALVKNIENAHIDDTNTKDAEQNRAELREPIELVANNLGKQGNDGLNNCAHPSTSIEVNGGSLAEKAGLQVADAVIKVNGQDVFNLKHKDAQDVIVKAGSSFEVVISRGPGGTWKPSVSPIGSVPAPSPVGGAPTPVTKTSLAYKGPASPLIGSGHNTAARPFSATPQLNGMSVDTVKSIASKQYNNPVNIYSDQTIAETLSAQAEVLAGGVLGVNFMKNEKAYNSNNSEVLKMVQEIDSEPRSPEPVEPAIPSSGGVIIPPPVSGLRHVSAPEYKPPSTTPSQPLPPGQNICADCERLIVGVFVRIKDKNLHVECFKCATCGTSLKNVGYYNINNKLYCDVHAKLAARANPPAPNLDPVTIPPGGRIPSGVVPVPLSAAPLSPQPSTMAPLPFHAPRGKPSHVSAPRMFKAPAPSLSGPKPFGAPAAPAAFSAAPHAPAPFSAAPPAPAPFSPPAAPVPPPFASPMQAPYSPGQAPSFPNFPKTMPAPSEPAQTLSKPCPERTVEIEDISCCLDRSKRMSVCSNEVCELSDKKSALKAMSTLAEEAVRASPIPFNRDNIVSESYKAAELESLRQSQNIERKEEGNVQITRKTKVEESFVRSQKMYTAEISSSSQSVQVRAASPEMEQIMERKKTYQSYHDTQHHKPPQSARCLTPEIENIMEKPHGSWSPMPPACMVRPITPGQIISFPPDIPPNLSPAPRPRVATPEQFQEARDTVERFVDHTKHVKEGHSISTGQTSQSFSQQSAFSSYSQHSNGQQTFAQQSYKEQSNGQQQYIPRFDAVQGFSAYVGSGNSGNNNGNQCYTQSAGGQGNQHNGNQSYSQSAECQGNRANVNQSYSQSAGGQGNGNHGNGNHGNNGNGNHPYNRDGNVGGGNGNQEEEEPTVTEPDEPEDKSRKSSRGEQSQKSSRKPSSTEEESSSRRVFSDFGGPQISSSVDIESTTEDGVQKTSVTKSQKKEYSSCEFESTRKSTVKHHDSSGVSGSEDIKITSGDSRKQSEPSGASKEEDTMTKSQVEEIIKQELNKVFNMAQTMEKTDYSKMYDQKSQQKSTEQTSSQAWTQSSKKTEYKPISYGDVITKTGKLTSGLTIAPARPFTPQGLESNYPLPYQNIPSDFPPPRSIQPAEPPPTKSGYIPLMGVRPDSPLIHALTIAPERPYSPLQVAPAPEPPTYVTQLQRSSMLEALTTAPSTPYHLGATSEECVKKTQSLHKTTESKHESFQKYAPKPEQKDFKPILKTEPKAPANYVCTSRTSETCTVQSFPPVTNELKSAFKSTSKVQSTTFTESEKHQTDESKLSVKTHQRNSSTSRVDRPMTPSGLNPPNYLPYYQQHIGEIPLAHRSNSPVPHQIKAPSITPPPPRASSVERRGSVKAMSEAYTQQLASLNQHQQQQQQSSVSYVSSGAYSSGSVTKAYSYEQEHKSIDPIGYHASPLAGKLPLAGEHTLPKCSSPVLGKLDHTKQVFKPAVPPLSQPVSAFRSPVAEQANLKQAPPFFTQEKEKPPTPWAVIKDNDSSFKPPQPQPTPPRSLPIPQTSRPSLPTFPSASKPSFPDPPKPFSLPGVKPPSDAGPGAAKGSSTAGTVAPRRGRGVLNAAVGAGARVPLCGSCNSHIRGPFITALGKIWCPEHFTCVNSNCRRPLQDIGFVEDPQGLYCEFCFEKYLAPSCSKCNGKVKGDCLNAIGKHFHPECFTCAYCGKLFGNNPFFLEDALPYCEADWNELFTTKCFSCGFPIEAGDRWVEALNNNYHSQCFNCTSCKKNLEGQSFFAKGGRPFCKNHAR